MSTTKHFAKLPFALVPTAVGANPVATISALSELVAEGITGIHPGASLL